MNYTTKVIENADGDMVKCNFALNIDKNMTPESVEWDVANMAGLLPDSALTWQDVRALKKIAWALLTAVTPNEMTTHEEGPARLTGTATWTVEKDWNWRMNVRFGKKRGCLKCLNSTCRCE